MKDGGVGREGLYEEAARTGVADTCGKFAKTEISTVTLFFDASAYLVPCFDNARARFVLYFNFFLAFISGYSVRSPCIW